MGDIIKAPWHERNKKPPSARCQKHGVTPIKGLCEKCLTFLLQEVGDLRAVNDELRDHLKDVPGLVRKLSDEIVAKNRQLNVLIPMLQECEEVVGDLVRDVHLTKPLLVELHLAINEVLNPKPEDDDGHDLRLDPGPHEQTNDVDEGNHLPAKAPND